MAHLLLILEPHGQRAERGRAGGEAAFAAMQAFAEELAAEGVLAGVNALRREGTRVQRRDGQAQLLDGPFAESKELVGGYFLLDGVSREQALAIAARCPAAQWATVEVRETGTCYE